MKKRVLIIFSLISLFFMNCKSVNAAKELTCVYLGGTNSFIYVQSTDGDIYFYSFDYGRKNKVDDSLSDILNGGDGDDWSALSDFTADFSIQDTCHTDLTRIGKKNVFADNSTISSYPFINRIGLDFYKEYDYNIFQSNNKINNYTLGSCEGIDYEGLFFTDDIRNKYTQSCIYSYSISIVNYGTLCYVLQLSYDNNGNNADDFNYYVFGDSDYDENKMKDSKQKIDSSTFDLIKDYDACPPNFYISVSRTTMYKPTFSAISSNDHKRMVFEKSMTSYSYESLVNIIPIQIDDCGDLLSDDLVDLISKCITYVKILLPILLIVLGIIDFGSSIFSDKEEDMKKNAKKFLKRVIICLVIFLLPTLLKTILNIASLIWTDIDPSFCGIL